MAKAVSRKKIMEVLGIDTDRTSKGNMMYTNYITPIEKVPVKHDWNLEPEGLPDRGFEEKGRTLTVEARKGTYRTSDTGDVGYWCRQYRFFYNKDQDQVAVLYKYYYQWADGVCGSDRTKRIYIFDANTFR